MVAPVSEEGKNFRQKNNPMTSKIRSCVFIFY
jgi:hypothetical protein